MSELAVVDTVRLAELEDIVERGLATFVEVGEALMEIRDSGLYEQSHLTFDAYCRDRWQMQRAHAYRLIQSASVASALSPIGDTPKTESQARELAPLLSEPDALREAWAEVVDLHPEPTAKQVREVVERRLPAPRMATERDQHATMVRVWDGACGVLDDFVENAAAKIAHLVEFDGPGPITADRLEQVAAFATEAASLLRRENA